MLPANEALWQDVGPDIVSGTEEEHPLRRTVPGASNLDGGAS